MLIIEEINKENGRLNKYFQSPVSFVFKCRRHEWRILKDENLELKT